MGGHIYDQNMIFHITKEDSFYLEMDKWSDMKTCRHKSDACARRACCR